MGLVVIELDLRLVCVCSVTGASWSSAHIVIVTCVDALVIVGELMEGTLYDTESR